MKEPGILELIPNLRRYARALVRNSHDAEDLLQDCLVSAYGNAQSWRGINRKAWLMKIMTNLNYNRLRKQRSTRALFDEDGENIVETVASPPAGDFATHDSLRRAVELLDPDQRAVLMLVAIEGYSYGECADILQIPQGTVMSRLSRARKFLATHLSLQNGDDHTTPPNVIALRRPK
ncbi:MULTISPECIES: RNA polymerase sigma factor [unclassified Thalassospira]|uniref:RNA polymerase sigma factor n=1 Tax=unclassified Thalassospira TaxID=2648997 RepID=UPI000A1EB859|nr:RNA polymerase sigma factor [Thalassospira sp. MCCC 1A01428]